MKQSRRQELKTNELSVFLQQAYDTASRNVNYIIGGLVAVVLILVIVLYIQHRRSTARESAWNQYNTLQGEVGSADPEALNNARSFAAEMKGHQELGPRSEMLVGDMAYNRALDLSPTSDNEERLNLLREARDRYQNVVQIAAGQDSVLVARARLGLAAAEESLLLAGEGSREKIREQYETLAKAEAGLYSEMAADLLETLDERLRPLELVATRPAESSATAPATRAATTQAASTQAAGANGDRESPPTTQAAPQTE